MEFIKNYFKGKTIAFYIAFGVSAFSLISAIIYAGCVGSSEYMSWGAFVMLLLAFPAFLALSYFGYSKIASGVVAALNLAALALLVIDVFPFVWTLVNHYAMTGDFDGGAVFGGAVAVLVFTAICAITANVLAWLKLNKEAKTAEITADVSEEKPVNDGEGEMV